MTAEQQLERSVLEGKERDELSAIAQAMSLKTTTRTKKADIIDRILDATGVTTPSAATNGDSTNGDSAHGASNGDGNGSKPARRPRAAAAAVTEAAELTASEPSEAAPEAAPAESAQSEGGPAVFVEPPELSDGNEPSGAQRNGQGASSHQQANRSRPNQGQNQNNRNNQNNQNNRNTQGGGNDDVGNRRSNRRRRGRDRQGGGTEGDLQGAGSNQDQQYQGELIPVRGLLDLRDEGYGFLRCEG